MSKEPWCWPRSRHMRPSAISLSAAFLLSIATAATAQVTRFEISTRTPVKGGPFGSAGAYENIRGQIYGEVGHADRGKGLVEDVDVEPVSPPGTRSVGGHVAM